MGTWRGLVVVAIAVAACSSNKPAPDLRPTTCRDASGCQTECDRAGARACKRAAFIYANGRGVPDDQRRAEELDLRAADLGERGCDHDIDGCGVALGALDDLVRARLIAGGVREYDVYALRDEQLAREAHDVGARITDLAARVDAHDRQPGRASGAVDWAKKCDGGDDDACLIYVESLVPHSDDHAAELPDEGWRVLEKLCARNVEGACARCWYPLRWRRRDGACGS